MLTVLLHGGVGDVVAVVTRYYGGTKLGTGGLVRAYGGAVQEALATLPRRDRVEAVTLTVRVGYAAIGAVQPLWALHEAAVRAETFAAEATYQLDVPRDRVDALVRAVADATRGTGEVRRGG
jgi:putative IMPACT (imprinted ancient) family translation regulator